MTISNQVIDPQIRICAFGAAWLNSDPPSTDLQTPAAFRPPEATFAKNLLGCPADVWILAGSLYEIMSERSLSEFLLPDVDFITAEMISCLGLLPRPRWNI